MAHCSITFTESEIIIDGSSNADDATVESGFVIVGGTHPGDGTKVPFTKVSLRCGRISKSSTGHDSYTQVTFQGYEGDDAFTNDTWIPSVAYGGEGKDTLRGGKSTDLLYGMADRDTLDGRDGADGVFGLGGNDLMYGGSGNDNLFGLDGSDVIFGGPGDDRIFGGTEKDLLLGEEGHDFLYGGPGDDTLRGHEGNDELRGGAGADFLRGDSGLDVLRGGTQNDTLYGGGGFDQLFGDDGNDGLYGGLGFDTLQGGAGADRILVDPYNADFSSDLASSDARVEFMNGGMLTTDEGVTFAAGEWTEAEIERVDFALEVVHETAGDTHLLKRPDESPLVMIRRGAPNTNTVILAWNNGESLSLPQGVFDGQNVIFFSQVIFHEIGHFWGSTSSFRAISGWLPFGLNLAVPPGYVRAVGVDEDGNPVNMEWIYKDTATFAEPYAMTHPDEDFAVSFAALLVAAAGWTYVDGAGVPLPGAAVIPDKIAWLYNNIF
jgi:hypothetical protein